MNLVFKEIITLSTPRGRLIFWALATFTIFILPYRIFENLSLWQRLGWDSAPSIGLTRAYWLLIHGDFVGAWNKNNLIYGVIAIGFPLLVLDSAKLIKSIKFKSKQ